MFDLYKIFKFIGSVLFVSLLFIGCNEDDEPEDLFEESPAQRTDIAVENLREVLQSSNTGWKMVYFTDDTQIGGFTYIFKFLDDQRVEMTSDFDDNTSFETTEYDVILGSTVKLSFSTRAEIHKLGDANIFPTADLRGRGYLGDLEFSYYGMEGDQLVFRTNKYLDSQRAPVEVRFVPATNADIVALDQQREISNAIENGSVYISLSATDASGATTLELTPTIGVNSRYVTAIDNSGQSRSFGYAFTSEGITIRPPFEVQDGSISRLTYNSDTNEFVGTSGGNMLALRFLKEPTVRGNDNLKVTTTPTAYGYIDANLASSNSLKMQERVSQVKALLQASGLILTRIQFFFNSPPAMDDNPTHVSGIRYRYQRISDGSNFSLFEFTDITSADGVITITPNGDYTGTESRLPLFEPVRSVLIDSQGLFVKEEDYTVRFSNTIFSFTGVANPSLQMVMYAFQ